METVRTKTAAPPEPIAYSIADAVRVSGLSRSRIYELLRANALQSRVVGRRRLIVAASLQKLVGEIA